MSEGWICSGYDSLEGEILELTETIRELELRLGWDDLLLPLLRQKLDGIQEEDSRRHSRSMTRPVPLVSLARPAPSTKVASPVLSPAAAVPRVRAPIPTLPLSSVLREGRPLSVLPPAGDAKHHRLQPMACSSCGHQGRPVYRRTGTNLLEILLWLCGGVPGLCYRLLRRRRVKSPVCSCCGLRQLEPMHVGKPPGRKMH